MQQQNVPMSWEDYKALERPFGWKVEYWDGQARFTPRGMGVKTRIDLTSDAFPPPPTRQHKLAAAEPSHAEEMMENYVEVFSQSVEFFCWPLEEVKKSAERDIQRYFSGKRGEPLSASVVALDPASQQLAGLALFVLKNFKKKKRPHLELLYVRSPFQRQGIATAMLLSAIDNLRAANFSELFSTYHICNHDSQQWHHTFGFQDVYDAYYVRIRLGWLKNEIWRREKLGNLEIESLVKERDQWQAQIDAGLYQDWDDF